MERLHRPRNPLLLFFGMTGIIALTAFINIVPPDTMAAIIALVLLLATTIILLGLYAIKNLRHILLFTFGILIYLALQFFGLRNLLYAVLLVASLVALEYLWKDNG